MIDLDDDLLDAAKAALRTHGISDTVRRALEAAAAAEARARQVQWLTEGGLSELADPDARADIWR